MKRGAGITWLVATAVALCALPSAAQAQTASFVNSTRIHIPGGAIGLGTPHPSDVNVTGFPGTVTATRVQLIDVTAGGNTDELDLVLAGPQGQKVLLASDACGSNPVVDAEFGFDDLAAGALSDSGPCPPGTYKPSNYLGGAPEPDDLGPSGGPAPPYSGQLSVFNGTSPNGTWSLYALSDTAGDFFDIGAWALTLDIQPPTGKRAAALKKCKGKRGKPRKKCKKKAQKLPV